MTYADLFTEHEGFYAYKGEHYLFAYQEILEKYTQKGEPVNLLEIGVLNGGSLQLWKKFLPEGSQIYGVDISTECANIPFNDENIHLFIGNGTSPDFWAENMQDVTFDIIIDDGSHMCPDVINSFELLFPLKLNMGGTYIVESLQTSYLSIASGGYKLKGSSIEYLKNLIDYLNFNYIEFPQGFNQEGLEPLKDLNKQIKRVSFYDSICAIEKYGKRLKKPFENVISGSTMTVNKFVDQMNNTPKIKDRLNEIEKVKKCFE